MDNSQEENIRGARHKGARYKAQGTRAQGTRHKAQGRSGVTAQKGR